MERHTHLLLVVASVALSLAACRPTTTPAAATPLDVAHAGPGADAHYIPDSTIASAVRDSLILDQAVEEPLIDVTVTWGIVELTGTQSNLLAKERATRLAEMVRGVLSVSNRITVVPQMRADTAIVSDITMALHQHPATRDFHIKAIADAGVVTLDGRVHSWAEKQLADRLAKSIRGVRVVDDRLDVTYPTRRADSEIQEDINSRLAWDARIDANLIEVGVKDGVVTLSGVVGSAAERRRVRQCAWVDGTKRVDDSEIAVKWWLRRPGVRPIGPVHKSDQAITRAVNAALRVDPRVKAYDIFVTTDGGEVHLSGEVSYFAAKLAAADIARHTVGVVDVVNDIGVKWMMHRDASIERRVKGALGRDAIVDPKDITVRVDQGIVTLSGTVTKPIERSRAAIIAAQTFGVRDVTNQITVRRRRRKAQG